jgi:hypothetical protein
MAVSSRFDALASEMSDEERSALLERIRGSVAKALGDAPPVLASEGPELPEPEEELKHAGFIAKLILKIRSIFTGKSPIELLNADLRKRLMVRVELLRPSAMNLRKGLLLEPFMREIEELRDSARYFHLMLDKALLKEKEAFYAYLCGLEFEEAHARLVSASDAAALAELNTGIREQELKAMLESGLDEAFGAIPPEGAKAMDENVRALTGLQRIAAVPYDRILAAFSRSAEERQKVASAQALLPQLKSLAEACAWLPLLPSPHLVQSLFLFHLQDEAAQTRGKDELEASLKKASAALSCIDRFVAGFPIRDLVRCVSGDMAWRAPPQPGPDDWLSSYKAHFRARADASYAAWLAERKRAALIGDMRALTGHEALPAFANIRVDPGENDIPVKRRNSLVFLLAVASSPKLMPLFKPLKILLMEGEFFKKDNRAEFVEAYNELLRLPEALKALDAKLGPEGEYGKAWARARDEVASLQARRAKVSGISHDIDAEAGKIVDRAAKAFESLSGIIRGVLRLESGGRYESIANFATIDGRANEVFMAHMAELLEFSDRSSFIMLSLSELDRLL